MIDTAELLRVFQSHRGEAIVVPGRGGRHWVGISTRPNRDLPLGDPAMGGHASFALGLALARPREKIVLFDSEGDVLMGMGALATIAEQQPRNFYHFMLDNECYATTGGQPVPNAKNVAYDGMARACGYRHTHFFDNLERFSIEIGKILAGPAPGTFVLADVTMADRPTGSRQAVDVMSTRVFAPVPFVSSRMRTL